MRGLRDQPVDHQPVLVRVDVGHARVMPLEVQARGRDDAEEVLQRRERDRGLRRAREPGAFAPADVRLELRRHAVGRGQHRRAERAAPLGDIGGQVLREAIVGARAHGGGRRERAAPHRRGAAQEATPDRVRRRDEMVFRRQANAARDALAIRHRCAPPCVSLTSMASVPGALRSVPRRQRQCCAANCSRSCFNGFCSSIWPAMRTHTRPADLDELLVHDPVVHGVALAAPADHTGRVHQRKMPRHIGLRGPRGRDDLRDRALLPADRVEDAQPRRLGQHAEIARDHGEHLVELVRRRRRPRSRRGRPAPSSTSPPWYCCLVLALSCI